MRRLLLYLLPGGGLVIAAVLLLEAPVLRSTAQSIVPAYPIAVFAAGMGLGWRFGRTRIVLTLLLLLLADQMLGHATAAVASLGRGRAVVTAVAVLLPLDLGLVAWLPDRGFWSRRGALVLGALGGEAMLVGLLSSPTLTGVTARLDASFSGVRVGVMGDAALAAFAVAFVAVSVRFAVSLGPTDGGTVWVLAAAFLALTTGRGGLDATIYLATGALILVVSLVETSHRMAYADELTGLPARRALEEALAALRGTYAVAMIDIDHFKRFNDEHGHAVGDQLLRMVGARLSAMTGGGRAFRYGGEEFAVIFPGKSGAEAKPHLEALRRTIEASPFTLRGPNRPATKPSAPRASGARTSVSVTVSIGVAESGEDRRAFDVVRAADALLYRAKRAGRNRVKA